VSAKKQHYVPQFYLRRFANEERFFAYDKQRRHLYPTNVRDVASERYFYDVPAFDSVAGVAQALESFFQPFETAGAVVVAYLDELELLSGAGVIRDQDRIDLSLFLGLQYLRTKEARESLAQLNEALEKTKFLAFLRQTAPDLEATGEMFDLTSSDERRALVHATAVLDEDTRIAASGWIHRHYWILLRNVTAIPFVTSDHPVAVHNSVGGRTYALGGLGNFGTEVAYPLSTRTLLLAVERRAFPQGAALNGTMQVAANPEHIVYYNSLQVLYSYSQVFGPKEGLDLAADMVKETPELGNPTVRRIDIR